jgi:hypothetical protein
VQSGGALVDPLRSFATDRFNEVNSVPLFHECWTLYARRAREPRVSLEHKRVNMKKIKIGCIFALTLLAASAATASEVTIVSGVLGPEGPLYIDGNLYFVGWISNTLSRWNGKTTTVLNTLAGCGHNGLALTKQKTFLLACTDEHGAILELDMSGKQLRSASRIEGPQSGRVGRSL